VRVRHQPLDRGVEKAFDLIDIHVSASQNTREQFIKAITLGDGQCLR
jgi:hypothetical protein